MHLFRTYTCPIIRSGLSSFSLRTAALEPLTMFHRKTMRGILNLSKSSNIPALHFLMGELPIEAKIHRDVFALFFSVWSNPDSKIYQIVKYLLETALDNSRTWSIHLRNLSEQYGLSDPLEYLKLDPPAKSQFKEDVLSKICAHHERSLRAMALGNSKMLYLNVSLTGLRGRHHPALTGLITTQEVRKARIHLKMLSGDYLTYEIKSNQSGGSPHCRCCPSPSHTESIQHILTICEAYSDLRNRILAEYKETCELSKSKISFSDICSDDESLSQFILDPSSLNLRVRVPLSDPILVKLFQISRDYCHAINAARTKILTRKENEKS